MQARLFPHPWSACPSFHSAKFLRFPDEQLISLADSFSYVSPAVIEHKLIALSEQPSPSTFDPPSRVDNTIIFSQENALPKIEFQSPFWDSISDQAKSCIRYLVTLDLLHRFTAHKTMRPLVYPYYHHHRLAIPHLSLLHPHNWSPRAKWHNTLTCIRIANKHSYFAATTAASRSSTQSSGGWNDQDHSPCIVTQAPLKEEGKEEKGDLGRGDTMPGSFEPSHRELSLPYTKVVGKSKTIFWRFFM